MKFQGSRLTVWRSVLVLFGSWSLVFFRVFRVLGFGLGFRGLGFRV